RQTSAPPGGLVAGEETYRATRHVIRYRELEPVQAKGKRDPVEAWLPLAPIRAPPARPPPTAPLVGRGRELGLLDSIWERAVAQLRPHLVTVVGPTGIGKSRITAEITGRIEAAGGRAIRGRCLPYGQTGYRAFTEQVHTVAGIFESDATDEASGKLGSRLRELMGPDDAGAPAPPPRAVGAGGAGRHRSAPAGARRPRVGRGASRGARPAVLRGSAARRAGRT